MIELITKETAVLSDCVREYDEKGRLGQVSHVALRGPCSRRCIASRQIVGANHFSKECDVVVEKLRRLVDLMQVGLQVRFPLRPSALSVQYAGCRIQPVQLETIEQNNQILNNLGSLDGKMDSVSSRVDSIGFGVQSVQEKVQDVLEQQDSHNKKVRALACIRSIAIGSEGFFEITCAGRGRA